MGCYETSFEQIFFPFVFPLFFKNFVTCCYLSGWCDREFPALNLRVCVRAREWQLKQGLFGDEGTASRNGVPQAVKFNYGSRYMACVFY